MSVFLSFAFLAALLAHIGCNTQRRGPEASGRRFNRIQHGQCTYTFILPEQDGNCRESTTDQYNTNALQRDAPHVEQDFSSQKLQHLEHVMENYTQWLQKEGKNGVEGVALENYIVENMKSEMVQLQQNAVQNHTATMLEIGTSLLSQTAEQTRKLTDVETQVLNQTSRLEIQLLENSLSTYKLEKQLLQQTHEILKIHEKNSLLEHKILEMEERHKEELDTLKEEKENLQNLVTRQSYIIQELEKQLNKATTNNSVLQKQQIELMDTVHTLITLCSKEGVLLKNAKKEEEKPFRDCADVYQSGFNKSGVYTIYINNVSDPKKVFCNMEIAGGGWTVIQHREDGSLDFQKGWKEYKMGFGSPSGEHWLGNEFIFAMTSQRQYSLRIELMDWEGNRAYSQYDRFHIGNEKQNYRLYLKGHSGTAGKQSSLILHGAEFSTKDADNDNCMCKCALMLTGGWWFDACGPSNLNGMFYMAGQNHGKLNGIKWHYFKGPSYSLRSTTMMIRPLDF
ncbi:angiopoietin-1 isoform X1 [Anas platyrhynchos]|uniref:Angiopoietin-1 n=1 Tax=Anas platyrhynchos TaxID=8839 RepID=A0A8B9QSM7_ANAPL|nr:angiopoietin-1 isoform X1 [Anas platyrhynchos]|eukprot:XP_005025934.1 angiopoietin-1 isoform X1 [Anas platyrhynchos]